MRITHLEVSQTLLSQMPRPYHIEALERLLSKIDQRKVYVSDFTDETKPKRASWGTGLFRIEADGLLTLIDSDWDTSD